MLGVRTGIQPERVRFQAQHVLFVEGKDQDALDPKVLSELFDHRLRIEPLGPANKIKSVAKALHPHHPTYYFLIDRDHHKIEFINHCWHNFPNPDTSNLLVWRRREIENYFLDPNYLIQSQFCQAEQDDLARQILQFANKRLFLDVANHVIISIREDLKKNWIQIFSNPDDFPSKEIALEKLNQANEFDQHRIRVENAVSTEEMERRFEECLEEMTNGNDQLAFGSGDWLDRVRGKKVLSQVINSGYFRVISTDGTQLQGREKINEVAKDLLRNAKYVPADFTELKRLIAKRIEETR